MCSCQNEYTSLMQCNLLSQIRANIHVISAACSALTHNRLCKLFVGLQQFAQASGLLCWTAD